MHGRYRSPRSASAGRRRALHSTTVPARGADPGARRRSRVRRRHAHPRQRPWERPLAARRATPTSSSASRDSRTGRRWRTCSTWCPQGRARAIDPTRAFGDGADRAGTDPGRVRSARAPLGARRLRRRARPLRHRPSRRTRSPLPRVGTAVAHARRQGHQAGRRRHVAGPTAGARLVDRLSIRRGHADRRPRPAPHALAGRDAPDAGCRTPRSGRGRPRVRRRGDRGRGGHRLASPT